MVVRRWIITLLAFALLSSLEGVSVDRFLSSTASQSPRQEPHESDFISPSFLSSEEASVSSNNGSSTGTPYCENGYSSPSTPIYIKGGLIEEESGLASSRQNQGILWIHNDNYDLKRVYAVSLHGANAGHVVSIIDLEDLPGINQYSDFEDLSVARCPYQAEKWCVFVGDVGNNAEWAKGTFLYVFEEPLFPDSVHNDPIRLKPMKPNAPITFRLNYEGYEYFKGPNIEALAVAGDGRRFWAFHKTLRDEGEGPASVWESEELPPLDNNPLMEDRCERDGNRTWSCTLSDKAGFAMRSNPYDGAELLLQSSLPSSLTVRSEMGEKVENGRVIPLQLKKIGKLRNPKPSCRACAGSGKMKNIRNISAADLSADGMRLLLATYGGIFQYDLESPFDLSSLFSDDLIQTRSSSESRSRNPKQITKTNRDGSLMTQTGKFWSGQEGVAFDYSFPESQQYGKGIWSVSEHHKRFYYLKCLD